MLNNTLNYVLKMTKSKLYLTLVLTTGIVILLNLLGNNFHFRLDLTADKRYTLSQATKDILQNLDEPVTVKVYFSEDLPPQLETARQDFQDLLTEYADLSDNKVVYEFLNPSEDTQLQTEAEQSGVQPMMVGIRQKDKMEQQQAYMGAVVKVGEQQEVIPVIQGIGAEYDLTTKIKKLAVTDKPVVGLLQGHGEPNIMEMMQVYQELSILYRFEPIVLTDSTNISSTYKTIAIIRPTDSFPDSHLQKLDAFLENQGNLLVALNRVSGDINQRSGDEIKTGLETWLEQKGLIIENQFLLDAQCASITMQEQRGAFMMAHDVQFPFLPIISTFEEHPITSGLEAIILPFASPIRFTNQNPNVSFTPLAYSSEISGTLEVPQEFDFEKNWTEDDFLDQNLPVAGILEQKDKLGKLVIVADGDFAVNGSGDKQQGLQPDNVFFMVNSIDWLSDDTGLIDLRTKGGDYRPIAQINEGTKLFFKYTNFLLPLLLVALYGFYRTQMRKKQRRLRMEQDFS